jgi:hypothetical protein
MSDAGSATFNHDIILGNNGILRLGDAGENIVGDGTDLTISSSNLLNLTATTDIVIPTNVGLLFTDASEKIESNGTDFTFNSGNDINLTATTDVNIPSGVGLTFGNDGEKIEGDGTDLTIAGNNINLTAVADVVIPNNVGIQFGGASEKIEGDGTDMTISANNLTIDAAADITLDAGGSNLIFASGGTNLLDIANSSSDVIIKPLVDAKDIIIHQYDGTSLVEFNDAGYSKFVSAALSPEVALTDAATVTWNSLTQPVAKVELTANRTMGLASGGVAGQFISLLVIQDAGGTNTLSWNAAYEFTGDTAPTLTSTGARGDLFIFRYNGAKWLEVGRNLNLVLS